MIIVAGGALNLASPRTHMLSGSTSRFFVISAYETPRISATSRAWSLRGIPHPSSCVIAYLDLQYFLYFGRNEHVLAWDEFRGHKWFRGHGEVRTFSFRMLTVLLAYATSFQTIPLTGEQVRVRHMEGLMHGFLALRTLDGKRLADGEITQIAEGNRVTSRLIFRFKDGSVYDDTTIFSQRGTFRLLSDHLVQRGPSFKQPMETSIDGSSGQITVRYKDPGGKEKILKERRDLPPDIANGLLLTLVKHIQPNVPQTTVSVVATTPKPRVVKLQIRPEGEKAIASGNTKHETVRYVVKVKIGGLAGLVAWFLRKQPPDMHVWVLTGNAPAFVKLEGPLYAGGPVWRIELATPAGF